MKGFALKPWMFVLGIIAAIVIPATVYGMTHELPLPKCRLDYELSWEVADPHGRMAHEGRVMIVPILDSDGYVTGYKHERCQ